MTDEERADAVLERWMDGLARPDRCEMAGDDYDRLRSAVAAAIREAVAVERERAAMIVMGNGDVDHDARHDLAERIRSGEAPR